MTIKIKVGMILFFIFLTIGIIGFLIQLFIVFPSFQELENENAIKDSKRVVQAIQKEIYNINQKCFDWAAWDDTYNFIEYSPKDYIETNLVFSTFIGNDLNLIFFYDHLGSVVWGEIYNLNTKQKISIKKFASNEISKNDRLFDFDIDGRSLGEVSNSGIIMTDKGLMIVAARPIITSHYGGPIRGTVVLGRFLDQGLIKELSSQTEITFKIYPINIEDPSGKYNEILNQITDKSNYMIDKKNNDFFSIYTSIPNINGKSIALIEAKIGMDITIKGKSTVTYAIYWLLSAAFIGLVAIIILLQWIVLNPLKKLNDHTLNVVKTSDFKKTILMDQQDEICDLSASFNNLIQNVYNKEKKQKFLLKEKQKLINELQGALKEIKTLEGLIPICASCKKIRDDQGYWNILESYIQKHSDAQFSHSMCPECSDIFYGNEDWYIKKKKGKEQQ